MSSNSAAKESTARTAVFPGADGNVAVAIIGIQHREPKIVKEVASTLGQLMSAGFKPGNLERFEFLDPQNYSNEVFIGYWLHERDFKAWRESEDVANWIENLSLDVGAPGVWLEVMTAPVDRYQYGAPVVQKDGLATLGELAKSDKFGYWGGYRDRVPASVNDRFESPLPGLPKAALKQSIGQRIQLSIPDNVCFIREGQDWSKAGEEERNVWKTTMDEVVRSWTGILVERAADSGTLNLRSMNDLDAASGERLDKQTQVAFLLSLDGIERAARTWKEHLAVHSSLIRMFREATFKPTMNIWAEMFILKTGDMKPLYVNCHPHTGLLPYFD